MTHPIFALRSALHQRLSGDATLVTLLGGDRLFETVPTGISPPYILFGASSLEEWSAIEMNGYIYWFDLDIWTKDGGDAEAMAIARAIENNLTQQTLLMLGFKIVSLAVRSQSLERLTADGLHHIRMALSIYLEADGNPSTSSR